MLRITKSSTLALPILLGLLGLGTSASAVTTSTWSSSNSLCSSQSNCKTTTADGITATVKAFSSQTLSSFTSSSASYVNTNKFTASNSLYYNDGYGFQVSANSTYDSGSPNHSVDNFGYQDVVLLQFSEAVTLKELKLGWSQYDSDVTIMAYMGDTSDASKAAGTITTESVASIKSTGGWELVANVADVGSTSATAVSGGTANFNANGDFSSSWWLVSAFNQSTVTSPTVGSVAGLTGGTVTDRTYTNGAYTNNIAKNWDNGYDFIKFVSVGGYKTPSNETPEPGSLALAGLALVALLRTSRKAKQLRS
jgi:hypothetical protein